MLVPWKESYDKPRQCIKSRDLTSLTKDHIIKAVVFPLVIHGCESWTIKKTEHQRINSNCGAGRDSLRVLRLQGDQTSQSELIS